MTETGANTHINLGITTGACTGFGTNTVKASTDFGVGTWAAADSGAGTHATAGANAASGANTETGIRTTTGAGINTDVTTRTGINISTDNIGGGFNSGADIEIVPDTGAGVETGVGINETGTNIRAGDNTDMGTGTVASTSI